MIGPDRDAFGVSYRKLAARLNAKPLTDDAVNEAYLDCAHWPLEVVDQALEALRTSSRFMPRPVQLIGACQDAARRHASNGGSVPDWVNHDERRYFCDVCDDTGFERRLECDGTGVCHVGRCGQNEDADHHKIRNDPHPFTRRCGCRATNPVLAKERDAQRRPAEGERGGG